MLDYCFNPGRPVPTELKDCLCDVKNQIKQNRRLKTKVTLCVILNGYLLPGNQLITVNDLPDRSSVNDVAHTVATIFILVAHLKFHLKRGNKLDMY